MTIKPADLVEALKARWLLVAAIAGALFALVAGLALMQPRQYQASASLLLDLSQTDPTDSSQQQQARVETDSVIATQVDLIKSGKVTDAVAKAAGFVEATPADLPPAARLQQAAARVRAGLTVTTGRQSNVLQIQYMDADPAVAARVANLTAQIYMREQVALRASTAQGSAQWFEARTADVRRRYEVAQKKLSDFQRAHDIIGMNRMDLEAEKLKNLSAHLVQAQADAAAAHSKSGSSAVPEVATSLVVQNIEEAVATQAGKVAQLAKSLGPNHPQMIAAKAELGELQGSLRAARSNQASSMTANSSAATSREAELRGEMAAQEDRMIRMSGVQDQLMVMQRDVEAARQTYDTVRQRFNEAALKSQISQPNATSLDQATVPLFPATPNLPLWFVGGIALGLLAGVAAVVLGEILRPRVRTVNGLAAATEVEVIADLSPKSRAVDGLFVPRQEAA
jgi:succinoglycan biosynthesis transport protein ExoP